MHNTYSKYSKKIKMDFDEKNPLKYRLLIYIIKVDGQVLQLKHSKTHRPIFKDFVFGRVQNSILMLVDEFQCSNKIYINFNEHIKNTEKKTTEIHTRKE